MHECAWPVQVASLPAPPKGSGMSVAELMARRCMDRLEHTASLPSASASLPILTNMVAAAEAGRGWLRVRPATVDALLNAGMPLLPACPTPELAAQLCALGRCCFVFFSLAVPCKWLCQAQYVPCMCSVCAKQLSSHCWWASRAGCQNLDPCAHLMTTP